MHNAISIHKAIFARVLFFHAQFFRKILTFQIQAPVNNKNSDSVIKVKFENKSLIQCIEMVQIKKGLKLR